MGEILSKIERGIAGVRDAGNVRISRIELGSITYHEVNAELSPNPKEMTWSLSRYKDIPVERIEYDKGVFIRIEIL